MFALTIQPPDTTAVTTHPSREAAYAQLLKILDATGHAHRVTQASWTHTSYEIRGARGRGRAAIDEICGCTHAESQHEDAGCTVVCYSAGRLLKCGCTRYQPSSADPTLVDTDVLAAATAAPPPREPT